MIGNNLKILENLLNEQLQISFIGRINLLQPSGQYIGCIFLEDGKIVGVSHKSNIGQLALDELARVFYDFKHIRFIVEPEIIREEQKSLNFELSGFMEALSFKQGANIKENALRPPYGVALAVDKRYIHNGKPLEKLRYSFFLALCYVSEYSIVKEIYENWPFSDQELTNALVYLRKQKILKVTSNK